MIMKKMVAFLLAMVVTLGCMSPIEAQAKTKGIDNCPYVVGGILGGKVITAVENFVYDGYSRGYRITFEDGTYARYSSLASLCYGDTNNLEYDAKYMVCRTDFSDGLLDADGNGIDDRDPLNTSGLVDTNFNSVADGAPLLRYGYVNDWRSEAYLCGNRCQHNVVRDWYILNCPACVEELKGMPRW